MSFESCIKLWLHHDHHQLRRFRSIHTLQLYHEPLILLRSPPRITVIVLTQMSPIIETLKGITITILTTGLNWLLEFFQCWSLTRKMIAFFIRFACRTYPHIQRSGHELHHWLLLLNTIIAFQFYHYCISILIQSGLEKERYVCFCLIPRYGSSDDLGWSDDPCLFSALATGISRNGPYHFGILCRRIHNPDHKQVHSPNKAWSKCNRAWESTSHLLS